MYPCSSRVRSSAIILRSLCATLRDSAMLFELRKLSGRVLGPLTQADLKLMADDRLLTKGDCIRRQGTDQWIEVEKTRELGPYVIDVPIPLGTSANRHEARHAKATRDRDSDLSFAPARWLDAQIAAACDKVPRSAMEGFQDTFMWLGAAAWLLCGAVATWRMWTLMDGVHVVSVILCAVVLLFAVIAVYLSLIAQSQSRRLIRVSPVTIGSPQVLRAMFAVSVLLLCGVVAMIAVSYQLRDPISIGPLVAIGIALLPATVFVGSSRLMGAEINNMAGISHDFIAINIVFLKIIVLSAPIYFATTAIMVCLGILGSAFPSFSFSQLLNPVDAGLDGAIVCLGILAPCFSYVLLVSGGWVFGFLALVHRHLEKSTQGDCPDKS